MRTTFTLAILLLITGSSCSRKDVQKAVVNETVATGKSRPVELFWSDAEKQEICPGKMLPLKYRLLDVNYPYLRKTLLKAGEKPADKNNDSLLLPVPLPGGEWEDFIISPITIMAPELAEKFPGIKTFAGKSTVYPADNIRLDISPAGVRAMILSVRGTILIDPFCSHDTVHVMSYFKKDMPEGTKQPFEK
jgi:hypothetical protein